MDQQRLQRFFSDLKPRVDFAGEVDAELDRQLARRFNVLDYLRTSEMGLSRVIADLFNPSASHGQGLLFLDQFLRGLQRSSEDGGRPLDLTQGYGDDGWTVREDSVRVRVERVIPPGRRRLDISVEFEGIDGRLRCLAIENKPYAGDQHQQVHAYLDFLEGRYGHKQEGNPTGHLLIYLSPTGEGPSEWSIDKTRLERELKERDFAVMGYSVGAFTESSPSADIESDSARLVLDYSLAQWFRACRMACDVERFRSFFHDAESYCERRFGGVTVTDATTQKVVSFLKQPDNYEVAIAVHRAWPNVRDGIVNAFAERIRDRVLAEIRPTHGDDIECRWTLDKRQRINKTHLDVTRPSWIKTVQVRVRLEAKSRGPNGWVIGTLIHGDQKESESAKDLRNALGKRLGERLDAGQYSSSYWPWQQVVEQKWRNWFDIPRTLAEPESKDAEDATQYFVDRFVEICGVAVPEIDRVLGIRG